MRTGIATLRIADIQYAVLLPRLIRLTFTNVDFVALKDEVVEFEDTLCDCPPTCSNIWYNPEISYAPFPGQGFPFSRAFERLTSNPNVNSRKFLKEYLKYMRIPIA